jgi:hypothetical protein
MLFRPKKLIFSPQLHALLLLLSLSLGFMQPAYCDSQPRAVFLAYIKALYYATSIKQVSKFYVKNARVPMEECLGTAAAAKLAELKNGYIYDAKIQSELLDGNTCTMKGIGIAQSNGYRCRARLDVIMSFEEGSWKIQYYTWQGQIPGHY